MHAEDFSQVFIGQLLLDVAKEVILLVVGFAAWHDVGVTATESVVFDVNNLNVVKVIQDCFDGASIMDVCNSTTVVGLSSHVSQGFKRNTLVMVQELFELLLGDFKVRNRELVSNIPAKWSKLSPLDDHSIKEAKTPEQLFKNVGL